MHCKRDFISQIKSYQGIIIYYNNTNYISLCRLLTAIPYLINEIYKLPDVNNLAIAFPDEGAHKRFHASFEQWPLITCIKKRNGDERHITVKEGITYYSLMLINNSSCGVISSYSS